MKKLKNIVITLLIISTSCGNNADEYDYVFTPKIISITDSLYTENQIEKILDSLGKREFKIMRIQNCKTDYLVQSQLTFCERKADSLEIGKSFYKGDFDKNGYTDILAIGEYFGFRIVSIQSYPNDSLAVNYFSRRNFQGCVFPKLKRDGNIDLFYQPNYIKEPFSKFTLTHKFGDFIEYNPNPEYYEINKIEFECLGLCRVDRFSLVKKGESEMISGVYDFEEGRREFNTFDEDERTFRTQLNSKHWNELTEILNYIDFVNLRTRESVHWTDDRTARLKIHFGNGEVVEIADYGLLGTYGLTLLYDKLFELRKNQNWIKKK